tara:strand:- start:968 stop:1171 length:204 start_codon:yes stop_codon:yes gene_type:complete
VKIIRRIAMMVLLRVAPQMFLMVGASTVAKNTIVTLNLWGKPRSQRAMVESSRHLLTVTSFATKMGD